MGETCRWPHKHRYATRAEARKAKRQMSGRLRKGRRLIPYQCGDHWHLGTHHKRSQVKAMVQNMLAYGTPDTDTEERTTDVVPGSRKGPRGPNRQRGHV